MALCRRLPLPLARLRARVTSRTYAAGPRLTIYDQLNPAFARYYTRAEASALLADAGFTDVRLHHRHGYSWTVVGRKPV